MNIYKIQIDFEYQLTQNVRQNAIVNGVALPSSMPIGNTMPNSVKAFNASPRCFSSKGARNVSMLPFGYQCSDSQAIRPGHLSKQTNQFTRLLIHIINSSIRNISLSELQILKFWKEERLQHQGALGERGRSHTAWNRVGDHENAVSFTEFGSLIKVC